MINVSVTLPIYARSESNLRQHWSKKSPRTKEQRDACCMRIRYFSGLIALTMKTDPKVKLAITLTRIRPTRRQALDDDNLRGSLKAARDGVADALGTTDADPRLV
jgi:hypothetical protein